VTETERNLDLLLGDALAENERLRREFARKARLLGVAGSGVTARWASPERAAELDAGRWTKRKLQHKACRDRRTAKIAARQAASELAPRRVAKPFRINAPNSVWQLVDFPCDQLKRR
jgi:hypothetical protein